MITILLQQDISKLLVGFLINVSSGYFIAATLTPTSIPKDITSIIINFLYSIVFAIIYFILAVKINRLFYE